MKSILRTTKFTFLTIISFLISVVLSAQEGQGDVTNATNANDPRNWYTSPWIWVIGAAVVILLLVALRGRGGGGRSRSDI